MPEWWPAVAFGWPAVVVSMVLAIAGIVAKKPFLLVVSAVLTAPLSYYLSRAQSWIAFAGPTILAGAYTVKRGLFWVAWCLFSMFAGTAFGLVLIVFRG